MALSKQITNENGITTCYHRISHVSLQDSTLTCLVESYVSKDYRESENYADSCVFNFDITVEEEESMGIRQLCYAKLKTLKQWTEAADC